jgi:hypothetical protein
MWIIVYRKIARETIRSGRLAAEAVTNGKIEQGAITGDKVREGILTGEDVKEHSLTGEQIDEATLDGLPPGGQAGGALAGSYPNPALADGVVTDANVAPGEPGRRRPHPEPSDAWVRSAAGHAGQ